MPYHYKKKFFFSSNVAQTQPPTNAENDWTCAEEHFSKSFNIQLDYTTRNVVWISPAR